MPANLGSYVLPKSQKRLQVLRFTIRDSSYVSQEQYTAGAVSRFDRFHVEINSQQGERFIRSALQPASRTVKRKGRRKRSALEDDRTSNAGP